MKKIILMCLFLFVGYAASAQTPEDRADFLTNELTSLLSLSSEQQVMVKITNRVYYRKNQKLIQKRDNNEAYQAAMAGTLPAPEREAILNKVNQIETERKQEHSKKMRTHLTDAQYALYLQNIDRLFDLVKAQYGE